MFLDFFYSLRKNQVPVSTREYLDLLTVLQSEETINLDRFYLLARTTLIKDIKYYDAYDVTFAQCFGHLTSNEEFKKKLQDWLEEAKKKELSQEQIENALQIPPEDILKELNKRIQEQKERHDGGNYWIGTGGTSPFGNSGFNPQGIRIGGQGGGRSAIAVVGERKFKDYRSDEMINVRNIKVALKKLRVLKKSGRKSLDLDKTIKRTCENAGEIDIVETPTRKNNLKLILLMDVGGSMTPHSERVEKLFSAAHQINHFKKFQSFYFHNIFYDKVYKSAQLLNSNSLLVKDLFKQNPRETRIIIIGDAYMAPYELFQMTGGIRDFYFTMEKRGNVDPKTGYDRVAELKRQFSNTVWLNPEPQKLWNAPTIKAIRDVVPMFSLTLEGVEKAIKKLV